MISISTLDKVVKWMNDNSGFLSVMMFIFTLIISWMAGVFKFFNQKPKFKIELRSGPNVCSIIHDDEDNKLFRMAFSLYVAIKNIGNSASSIDEVQIYYKRDSFHPFNLKMLLSRFFYFSKIFERTILEDFTIQIGPDNLKILSHFRQASAISPTSSPNSFFNIGEAHAGVCYFEEENYSWGKFKPLVKDNQVEIKIVMIDVFGGRHSAKARVFLYELEAARSKFNQSFGKTYFELKKK